MDRKAVLSLGAVAAAAVIAALLAPSALLAQEGDPYTIETMYEYNGGLKALWMDIQIEQIEVLTLGEGRASSRLHRQPFRWVAGDARRNADGSRMTYLVHQAGLGPAPIPQKSLTADRLANAIRAALDSPVIAQAEVIGERIRAEDGLTRAVHLIEQNLAMWSEHRSAKQPRTAT